MMRLRHLLAALFLALALGAGLPGGLVGQAYAVNPDEMLADPALEARARVISAGLRCLVCQNESIDDSNADLARDLRLLVRKRLLAGDTDKQVVDYLVSRYGAFVLLKPPLEWQTLALWGAPALLLLAGIGFAFVSLRNRARTARPEALSPAEEEAIERLLERRG